MDLAAGGRLRIVLPLHEAGFQIVWYNVTGTGAGEVELNFGSAESTRAGKTSAEPNPPKLPFQLPRGSNHVRLMYLIRLSNSDHDMAILAAKRLDELNAFTLRFRDHPEICRSRGPVFCSWVPAGVAVRPES